MNEAFVDIQNLTIGYPNKQGTLVHVLRNVSLQMQPGETVGLVGESGCGKSTLGQAMLGFLRSGSLVLGGAVCLRGQDMFQMPAKVLEQVRGKNIALIPQNAGQSLTPSLRIGKQILEALEFNVGITSRKARNRALELLAQVHLPDPHEMFDRFPHELSGGQQQRVAIAMALAGEPEMLVLDEPTTGLDVTTQAHILGLLGDIVAETKTAMMYISHDMGVIARVSDRVIVMYAGEIVEDAPVVDMYRQPNHPYTRGLLESIPRLALAGIPRSMAGTPPTPGVLPGCTFAPRCPFATEICLSKAPALTKLNGLARSVRCHRWEEVAAIDFSQELTEVFHKVAHTMTDEPALLLSDVEISYYRPGIIDRVRNRPHPPRTVSDVSLTVHKGETLALVGESGSGKSTIVQTIAGLLPAKGGSIKFEDFDLTVAVDERPLKLRQRIQMIFQNPDASLNPRHSVAQILDQPLRLYFPEMSAAERRVRQIELLERVRLAAHYRTRFPGQLSGGEKQRVAIARAFAADPEVVLCDEVTSALDVSVQAVILDLLADLQRENQTTYIFITHDLAVVRAFADRVAVLYQGRLCEVGTVEEITAPPYHPYTETLLGAVLEPDPAMEPKLMAASDTPELAPLARGCPFQRRCPRRIGDICDEEMPPWRTPSGAPEQQIRCHIPISELLSVQVT